MMIWKLPTKLHFIFQVQDPYELKTVKLVNSTAFPNSGEGVVANRNIPKDRIACMFSLFLFTTMEQIDIYTGTNKKS